jgi:hypothetical protein
MNDIGKDQREVRACCLSGSFLPLVDVEMPGSFGIDYRLGISDLAALYLSRLASHSSGLLFDVTVFQRALGSEMAQRRTAMIDQFDSLAFADQLPTPAEGFKFGVDIVGAQRARRGTEEGRSMSPTLRRLSWYGGCTDSHCDSRHQWYLWPLPKYVDIVFVCEWSAVGISETRTTVSGDELRRAAERAALLSGEEGEAES